MSEANKALVYRWFDEVWNNGSEAVIDEIYSATTITHGIGESDPDLHGANEFKPFVRNMRTAIPDAHVDVEGVVAEGDMVCVRLVLRGTHTGDGLGIAPSGRPVRIAAMVMARVTNGRIAEGWNSWDQLGLLRQVGAIPDVGNED